MIIFITTLMIFIALLLYKRYVPVLGIPFINRNNLDYDHMVIIDLRDFNISYKDPVKGAVNIPIAYLNRSIAEIPNREVYIIASSSLEKNLGIRLLRKKGFRVVGYTIYDTDASIKVSKCA